MFGFQFPKIQIRARRGCLSLIHRLIQSTVFFHHLQYFKRMQNPFDAKPDTIMHCAD
jgi:hypothetical protein